MVTALKYLITLVFIGLIFWFCLLNIGVVNLTLYPFLADWPVPIAWVLIVGVFAGFLWGGLIVWLNGGDVRRRNRELRSKIRSMESQDIKTRSIVP